MSIMDLQRKNFRRGGAGGGSGPNNSPGTTQSGGNKNSSTNDGPAGGASAGGNYGGNVNPQQTYGGSSNTFQETYGGGNTPNNFELAAANAKAAKEKKEKEEAKKLADEQRIKALGTTGPLKTNYKISYLQDLKNKSIQKSLNRNKVLAMRKMNLMKGFNPFNTQIPDWAKDLTKEELMGIATSGPYLGQQKTKADVGKFAGGKDLLSRVFEGQSILDTDNFPQSEYERLFPSNLAAPMGGGGNNQSFKINYNTGAAEKVPEDTVPEYTYRFGDEQNVGRDVTDATYAADGGIMGTRARRAFGGIMDRVTGRKAYGLGSVFKSVGKAFKGVAKAAGKVLKSDLGKAIILAGGYYYGGGALPGIGARGTGGFGTQGIFKGLKGAVKGSDFFSKMLMNKGKTGFSPFKIASMASPLLAFTDFAKAQPNETSFQDRGGPLVNSQGDGSQGSIAQEIQEAYASGDSEKIAELQKFYNYMLPSQDAVQDLSLPSSLPYPKYAEGGRINKAEGGLMDLGGMEKDYRNEGGFVPIGEYEKKDDVPARLSVNEFVMTADAVRGAGGGDIDKGAEIMENVMKNLEGGGQMSKESQGNTGAQEMFSVSQRLGEVL